MKNIIILGFVCIFIAGCSMSHKDVSVMKKRCYSIGGEPRYVQYPSGTVKAVHCVVDGITYITGGY